ncbi:response regulator [Lysinibacillus fusiformis]|uniref:response regulator n=1 Tax=Lysinibacillus fusiformis TaxID=28031 RepID=UPI000B06E773|nr:response regulator [Lysinibacillus fusiformis]
MDDEPLALISMEKHLQKFDRIEVIKTFTSVKDLLTEGPSLDFQVAFLDVEMPSMNGLDIAELLKSWNDSLYIVFVTAYRDYAVQAFELHSIDYLLKPISTSRLATTIQRIEDLLQPKITSLPTLFHSEPLLKIKCFGEFVVSYEGKPLHWRTIKTKELFALLLLHLNTPVPRDTIIDNLWSYTDFNKARVQLHTTVSYLRSSLSAYGFLEVIDYTNGCYILTLDHIQCDANDLEIILNKKEQTGKLDIESAEALLQDYRGEFMATMAYPWIASKANLMNKLFTQLLKELAHYYEQVQDVKNLERSLLIALELNPYSDQAVQPLIKHYANIGNRAEAIKIYRSFKRTLLSELNVLPMQETTTLFQTISEQE